MRSGEAHVGGCQIEMAGRVFEMGRVDTYQVWGIPGYGASVWRRRKLDGSHRGARGLLCTRPLQSGFLKLDCARGYGDVNEVSRVVWFCILSSFWGDHCSRRRVFWCTHR